VILKCTDAAVSFCSVKSEICLNVSVSKTVDSNTTNPVVVCGNRTGSGLNYFCAPEKVFSVKVGQCKT